jgi:hypothetical protein
VALAFFLSVRNALKNPVVDALSCWHGLLFAVCRSLRGYITVHGSERSQSNAKVIPCGSLIFRL